MFIYIMGVFKGLPIEILTIGMLFLDHDLHLI